MSDLELMLVAGVAIPLWGFVVLSFFGSRLGKPAAGWFATAMIALSCVLSTVVLISWLGGERVEPVAYEWARLGPIPIEIGVGLDGLTVIVYFMVSFIGTFIHLFSIGYMAGHSDEIDGESKYHRFFAYMNLFCFSMLGLVISNSLVLLFVFWELVGLCSYLLIGYYFDRKYASNAAIKAFVVNRVGDFGFLIGLGMVALYLNEFTLSGAASAFRDEAARGGPLFTSTFLGVKLATWMGILLFCGAIGKSAQFPLHVWLPDAMAGPTPVSALIHAATMVAAGVYLVARVFVLLTPGAQLFIATIGCITLTLAALVAIVQNDIKKVLAYSTISQLGYMILGMGVGAWIAALFHLLTHAFFKALMFLGSGQVIEGCHHEQDMRKMGGLWRKMPVTCATFLVGVLAIAGAGVPGTGFGLGGFFSKDEILAVAYHRVVGGGEHVGDSHHEAAVAPGPWVQAGTDEIVADVAPADHVANAAHAGGSGVPAQALDASPETEAGTLPWFLFILPVAIAYVTPFYMMRCWWLTFMGKPRDAHVHEHAHERPLMYVPLVVLALGTIVSGVMLFRPLVAQAHPQDFLVASFDGHAADAEHAHGTAIVHAAHDNLKYIVGGAFVVGFLVAWLIYRKGLGTAQMLADRMKPVYTLLVHKFYFDEIYGVFLVGGTHAIKGLCYLFDRWVVDGLVNLSGRITTLLSAFSGRILDDRVVDGAVNGVADGALRLGNLARSPQVGRIRNYILFAAGGATLLLLMLIYPKG